MSQADGILQALQAGETVTPFIAFARWGCLALHSRIAELRARGYEIDCRIVSHGDKTRWGAYTLAPRSEG